MTKIAITLSYLVSYNADKEQLVFIDSVKQFEQKES